MLLPASIEGIKPQFVIFEISYVFQTMYGATGERLATLIRDVITLPGARVIDDCPWKRVLDVWPDPFPWIDLFWEGIDVDRGMNWPRTLTGARLSARYQSPESNDLAESHHTGRCACSSS